MPQLFTIPRPRPLTTAGRIMPASKLYFYTVGTLTLADIYSDSDCTVAHTNPVVADGNGEFDAIYLSGDRDVTLKTSADVTIWGPETAFGSSGPMFSDAIPVTGTFTPTIVGLTTPGTYVYSFQIGRYAKVGRLVNIDISIFISSVSVAGTGNHVVRGCPFTCSADVSALLSVAQAQLINTPAGYHHFAASIARSASDIGLYISGDNTGLIQLQGSYLQASSLLTLGGFFFATE